MKRDIFRKSALDRIASLDQLDQTMTVVKPSNVLGIISVGILVIAAMLWGFFGSVPDIVKGSGVLVNIDHVVSVKYSYQGAIKNIFVSRGDKVYSGQIIARIERQDILDQIRVLQRCWTRDPHLIHCRPLSCRSRYGHQGPSRHGSRLCSHGPYPPSFCRNHRRNRPHLL